MNSFFQDGFINSKVLKRLAHEIRKEQLDSTIAELGYLNEVQSHVISKSDFYALQSERFVEETFAGSLPAFLAAFTRRKALSEEEIESLRRLIAEHKEE